MGEGKGERQKAHTVQDLREGEGGDDGGERGGRRGRRGHRYSKIQ